MLSRPPKRAWRVSGIALLLSLLCPAVLVSDVDVNSLPKPTGYVEDFAHVLSPQEQEQLEAFCTRVDRELGAQFALVTVDTLNGQPIRDFGLALGRKWGVGSKNTNQGLLLLLSIRDREDDIEVGRGLEPFVTDGFAGGVRRAMQPDLAQARYGAALLGAVETLGSHIADGKGISFAVEPSRRQASRPARQNGIPGWVIILGILFLFWVLGRGGRRGGGGGPGGFLTGMLIGDILGGGRRGDAWGGGGFGGGSGGGGFGGFGGGDFGGGGASGKW